MPRPGEAAALEPMRSWQKFAKGRAISAAVELASNSVGVPLPVARRVTRLCWYALPEIGPLNSLFSYRTSANAPDADLGDLLDDFSDMSPEAATAKIQESASRTARRR